jgi:peptidoglycan/LPS O-acetylase OafA/YrhL
MALSLLIVCALEPKLPHLFMHNGLLLPLILGLIFALASSDGWLKRWASSPPLVLLGGASYALYVLHIPLRQWILPAFGFGAAQSVEFYAVYLVAMLVVSVVVFVWFEEPVKKWLRRTARG